MMRDLSSHSKPEEVVMTHLEWHATVDFEAQVLSATATYTVRRLSPFADTVYLDTSHLRIKSVHAPSGSPLRYTLSPLEKEKPHLGQKLAISLPPSTSTSSDVFDACQVTVVYKTTEQCSALQWLPPAQTAGKVYPYLFSQCFAIHARSLVPCQDRCGVKMTYRATVTVPDWATCVMSALLKDTTTVENTKVFTWDQPVPISSYLFAIAVGDLAKKDISERCAIWSEPSLVDAAAYEFAETEQFLKIAEDLAGLKYVWGRYDLLCLPPSFAYGGAENPCLTFVTPTLLAGDRSLADVVAHEIAHSWTGNLVTNATWDHFWLNEGWTTWFQHKITARFKKDARYLDFAAIQGIPRLQDAVREMPAECTRLVLDIGDSDPDDFYSAIAYEKGFLFLLSLEQLVGTEQFESFFQAYIGRFASHCLTTDEFKELFLEYFKGNEKTNKIKWEVWIHQPGMPPEILKLDKTLAQDSQDLAALWIAVDRKEQIPPSSNQMKSWASLQKTCFLDELLTLSQEKVMKASTLKDMSDLYNLQSSRNSEILFRYCILAVSAEEKSAVPIIVRFITTQGRMKYVRPLYRALHNSVMGKELALSTFLKHQEFYHPICAKMIASDLSVNQLRAQEGRSRRNKVRCCVLVAATIGFIILRRRRYF